MEYIIAGLVLVNLLIGLLTFIVARRYSRQADTRLGDIQIHLEENSETITEQHRRRKVERELVRALNRQARAANHVPGPDALVRGREGDFHIVPMETIKQAMENFQPEEGA